jgi:hypothetical protein
MWVAILDLGVCLLALVYFPCLAHAERFADVILSHSLVDNPGTFPENVLGAPDELVADFERVDNSTPGFVTVQFSGNPIADESGDDLFIYLRDWVAEDFEFFDLYGSSNGSSFTLIGSSGAANGGAGSALSVVSFDMADGGFGSLSYLRIVNGRVEPLGSEGPDIDAIGAVGDPPSGVPSSSIPVLLAISFTLVGTGVWKLRLPLRGLREVRPRSGLR